MRYIDVPLSPSKALLDNLSALKGQVQALEIEVENIRYVFYAPLSQYGFFIHPPQGGERAGTHICSLCASAKSPILSFNGLPLGYIRAIRAKL